MMQTWSQSIKQRGQFNCIDLIQEVAFAARCENVLTSHWTWEGDSVFL